MPSFDVISEVDQHELTNAVDQANREISNRFDFKGTNARVDHKDELLTLHAPSNFQIDQVRDVLQKKITSRKIDIGCLEHGKITPSGQEAKQELTVRQGIDKELAKKIVKMVKESKLKLQASIQGEQVRVTGKKRDDLQSMMGILREASLDLPVQFDNFRD